MKRTEIRYSRHSKNHRVVDALGQPIFQAMTGIKIAVTAIAGKIPPSKNGEGGIDPARFFYRMANPYL
jgi:hypothetical protein